MNSTQKLTLGLSVLGAGAGLIAYEAIRPANHPDPAPVQQLAFANSITLHGVFADGGVRLTLADPNKGLRAPSDIVCIEYLIDKNTAIAPVIAAKEGNVALCAPLQFAVSRYTKEVLTRKSQVHAFTRYQGAQ